MRRPARKRRAASWEWAVVALITTGAAILRLLHLGQVPPDPFYDAAVRSMTLSWHNFFFGVYEPGGSVSIDKPPVDLWLQVASVKLFGFTSTDAQAAGGAGRRGRRAAAVGSLAPRVERAGRARRRHHHGGAADRGDHLAQRHDGRGDDGADRARPAARGARRGVRAHGVAAGRSGRARARVRRQAARVAGGAGGARRARLSGAARPASAAPAQAGGGRLRVCGRRAGLADGDAPRSGA